MFSWFCYCCRPILTDLAFYNRINLRLLKHLHRLLVRLPARPHACMRCGIPAARLLACVRRCQRSLTPEHLPAASARSKSRSLLLRCCCFACLAACLPACLQDLLSGQFNVTLGDKLSEHLKKWIDVGNILQPPQPVRGWDG